MITISPVLLALIGTVIALGSALVSGAVVWGSMREKVERMERAVEAQTSAINKLITDVEVIKARHSGGMQIQ